MGMVIVISFARETCFSVFSGFGSPSLAQIAMFDGEDCSLPSMFAPT